MSKDKEKGKKGRIILAILAVLLIVGALNGNFSSVSSSSSSSKEPTILDDYTFDDAYSFKTRTEENYCLIDYDTQTRLQFTKSHKNKRNMRIEKIRGNLDDGLYDYDDTDDAIPLKYNAENHKVEMTGKDGFVYLSGSRHSVDSALSHVRSKYPEQIKK